MQGEGFRRESKGEEVTWNFSGLGSECKQKLRESLVKVTVFALC